MTTAMARMTGAAMQTKGQGLLGVVAASGSAKKKGTIPDGGQWFNRDVAVNNGRRNMKSSLEKLKGQMDRTLEDALAIIKKAGRAMVANSWQARVVAWGLDVFDPC